MKKNVSKLRLTRETLRALEPEQAIEARGGSYYPPLPTYTCTASDCAGSNNSCRLCQQN